MQTPKTRRSSLEVPQKVSPQSSASEVPQKLSARGLFQEVPQKISPRTSTEIPQKISPRTSTEVPHKISARAVSVEVPKKISPRAVHKQKATGLESDSPSSSNHFRTPKAKSPKVIDRKSPRSPVPERKRPSKVADLESQISQLQGDLKKVKDQLSLSESSKQQAEQDAEESKKKLLDMSLKLDESQQLLSQSSSNEPHSIEPQSIELQKIIDEKDKAFQLELDASQTIYSNSSAELASALDEIRQLKVQLEMVTDLEAAQTKQAELNSAELLGLKENLAETRLLAENMKNQLQDSKESEVQAKALVGETLSQLETAKRTVESLGSDNSRAKEEYNAISLELDQSKARVNSLEELVSKLTKETAINDSQNYAGDKVVDYENKEKERSNEAELVCMTSEVEHLRSALETAEIKFHEEQIRNTLHITSAHEMLEKIKSTSSQREAELETELKKSKADVEELKANLMDKETELQGICEENEVLQTRLGTTLLAQTENQLEKALKKTKLDTESLKSNLIDKDTDLQAIIEENEMLKSGNKKEELSGGDEVVTDLEAARATEREALMKLGYATDEANRSDRRTAQMTEQLEAAQIKNSELEAELRRIKVQSDQWRKAAEAAASMLSTANNGKLVERTGSLDSNYSPITSSPYTDDMDNDFLKKKNGNMLKRIGVLWKKPQK